MHSFEHISDILTDINLNFAEQSDIEYIIRLSGQVFSVYGPYDEIVPRWFSSGETHTIIARMKDRPIGFVMIGYFTWRYDLAATAEIMAIAVDPELHNMGIGSMLLKKIEEKAADLNVKRLFLHTAVNNFPAQKLFKNSGYRLWEVKKDFYQGGQDAFVMTRDL